MARADMYDILLAEAQGVELEVEGPRPIEVLQHLDPNYMTPEEYHIWYEWYSDQVCRMAYGVCKQCDGILSEYKGDRYCPTCYPWIAERAREWEAGAPARRERSRQRRLAKLDPYGGPRCHHCGKEDDPHRLHFHHKEGAVYGGRDRRSQERNIREHPEMFELLCTECHGKAHRGDPNMGGRVGWRKTNARYRKAA